jgi:hypothetical protein
LPGGVAGVGVVVVVVSRLRAADRVVLTGVANLSFSHGGVVSRETVPWAWVDGMGVIDAAASGELLDELDTHDGRS